METTLNVDALRSVVSMIELYPELWDQRDVVRSLAGWTCTLARLDVAVLLLVPGTVFTVARDLLGLTNDQALRLFTYGRSAPDHPTVDQLKTRITAVTGERF